MDTVSATIPLPEKHEHRQMAIASLARKRTDADASVRRAHEAQLLGQVGADEKVLSGVRHRVVPSVGLDDVIQSSLVVVKDSYVQRIADAEGWTFDFTLSLMRRAYG